MSTAIAVTSNSIENVMVHKFILFSFFFASQLSVAITRCCYVILFVVTQQQQQQPENEVFKDPF